MVVAVDFRRLAAHLLVSRWTVRRKFSAQVLNAIEQAVTRTERQHGGELRFAVEGSLGLLSVSQGVTPRERAKQVFSLLDLWDTAQNNGVLIYVLLADHAVEIVTDRGYGDSAAAAGWHDACRLMEGWFAQQNYEHGAVEGIAAVGRLIARQFPAGDRNELPDAPVLL